jgi:outer membrane protein, multidrug efflux system
MKAMTTVRHLTPIRAALARTAAVQALGLALALAGCAQIPADTVHASAPDFARARHAAAIELARDAWPEQQWWLEYHDPQLDQLIAQALKDGANLAVAQARVASARAAVAVQQAAEGAQLGLGAGLNRQRYSGNGLFPEPIGGNFFNDASVQLKASYDFDWWGKRRALVASALGEANARQAEAAMTAQTLAAAVAQSYFRLQMLWARQDNTGAQLAVQRELLAQRKARVEHGLATIDEQRAAELDLGALGEQSQRLATQAAREREVLRALVGAGSEDLASLERRPGLPAVDALPRQLGVELLARRADLQAARWRVEAALGRVKASEAAFYPDLNLSAGLGLDSISLGKLLRYGSRTMLAGATLELPLFDAGRLDAGLGVARAQRDEMIADYNQAVLDAVRDIAAEGASLQGLEQQVRAHAQAAQASARLEANANARLQHGLADRGALLQAKLAVLRQQDVALQLQDARLQTQVALVRALGGGYRAAPIRTAASASTQQH